MLPGSIRLMIMNKIILICSVMVVLSAIILTYTRGLADGERSYKQSHRMYMTLQSAYHFGYVDGKSGKIESWDGPQ